MAKLKRMKRETMIHYTLPPLQTRKVNSGAADAVNNYCSTSGAFTRGIKLAILIIYFHLDYLHCVSMI